LYLAIVSVICVLIVLLFLFGICNINDYYVTANCVIVHPRQTSRAVCLVRNNKEKKRICFLALFIKHLSGFFSRSYWASCDILHEAFIRILRFLSCKIVIEVISIQAVYRYVSLLCSFDRNIIVASLYYSIVAKYCITLFNQYRFLFTKLYNKGKRQQQTN